MVAEYEKKHYPVSTVTGIDVLRFLMGEHGLSLASFPEIGNEAMMSDLLSGQRELDLKQIQLLAQRFGVSPATFLS